MEYFQAKSFFLSLHHLPSDPLLKDGVGDGDASLWRRFDEVGIDEGCLQSRDVGVAAKMVLLTNVLQGKVLVDT